MKFFRKAQYEDDLVAVTKFARDRGADPLLVWAYCPHCDEAYYASAVLTIPGFDAAQTQQRIDHARESAVQMLRSSHPDHPDVFDESPES